MGYLIVDLSSNQSLPNFRKMRAAGCDGVLIKLTEGATYNSDWDVYTEWAPRARLAGLRVGAYHYAQPSGGDAIAEARNFSESLMGLGGIQRRDFRPALDFEENPGNLSGAALVKWARDWNRVVWERTGTCPLFYSYPFFIASMRAETPIGCGLWLASWGVNDGQRWPYAVPRPWKKAVLHQYTSNGNIEGVLGRVDLNYAEKLRPLLAHPVLGLL